MVGFDESRKVGEAALSGASSNYKNTIPGGVLKRLIGLAWDDPRAATEMAFWPALTFCPIAHPDHNDTTTNSNTDGNSSVGIKVTLAGEEKILSVEAILGMMVQHLGDICAAKAAQAASEQQQLSGGSGTTAVAVRPQDWVLAIPAYYTDAQRRAVLTACSMVGIGSSSSTTANNSNKNGVVNRLLHESTATALAYGIFKDLKKDFAEKAGLVMFIDIGASAYTVSIASFEPGKLLVKSVQADPNLGGRDFDNVIAEWIAAQFVEKYKSKLVSGLKPMDLPKTRMKLLTAAEQAKKTLSPAGVKEARINLEMLQDDLDFSTTLTAETYEKLCQPLLARLDKPLLAALAEAGNLTALDLTAIELVGGSTRIGSVKRQLQSILVLGCSGKASSIVLSTTMNADESVARGAALQSAILSPRFKVLPYEIVEAQPFPIKLMWDNNNNTAAGVEVDAAGGMSNAAEDGVVMFDRGLTFPIVRRVTLKRTGTFDVHAVYDTTSTATPLGFSAAAVSPRIADFTMIQTITKEETKVRVNVKTDIHGIVHLSSAQMIEEIEDETEAAAADAPAGATEGETAAAAATDEKKKKIKKTNLECTTRRPLEWTVDEINRANEAEVGMANADRIVKETADMRNELESYIYDMRDKLASDSQLGLFGTADEKSAFLAQNEAIENWLYEDGFDAKKSAFAEKLAELKRLGGPMEKRQTEAMGRAVAVSTLQSSLALYSQWLNTDSISDTKYAHITDEDREAVRSASDSTSAWMYEMLDKQGSLAPHEDAVLTVADLMSKNQSLQNTCGPIMRKPVPPPPKKEAEPAKEQSTTSNDEGTDDKKDSAMDVDTEGEGSTPMQTD